MTVACLLVVVCVVAFFLFWLGCTGWGDVVVGRVEVGRGRLGEENSMRPRTTTP